MEKSNELENTSHEEEQDNTTTIEDSDKRFDRIKNVFQNSETQPCIVK